MLLDPQNLLGAAKNLRHAAACGDLDRIRVLLRTETLLPATVHPALCAAARAGHAPCVALLATRCNPAGDASLALCEAAENGHTETVRVLLPVSDPSHRGYKALYAAATGGYTETVALLLPVSGPAAAETVLGAASRTGNVTLIGMVLAGVRPEVVADAIVRVCKDGNLEGRLEALRLLLTVPVDSGTYVKALDCGTNLLIGNPDMLASLLPQVPQSEADRFMKKQAQAFGKWPLVLDVVSPFVSVACLMELPEDLWSEMPVARSRVTEVALSRCLTADPLSTCSRRRL